MYWRKSVFIIILPSQLQMEGFVVTCPLATDDKKGKKAKQKRGRNLMALG